MISFDTIENAKKQIKTIKPDKLVANIMTQADENEMSPSQLIDAVRDEIAELVDGGGKMSAAKRQAAVAALEIELYTLRRGYHTMLAMRRAKSEEKVSKKTKRKATRKAS